MSFAEIIRRNVEARLKGKALSNATAALAGAVAALAVGTAVKGILDRSDGEGVSQADPPSTSENEGLIASQMPNGPLTDAEVNALSPNVDRFNVPVLLKAIQDRESSGDYEIVNSIGALGAYQFLPVTAWNELSTYPPLRSALGKTFCIDKFPDGYDNPEFQKWFISHPAIQDFTAIQYIHEAVLNGATSPKDIGEFWLGGNGGLRNPDEGADIDNITPRVHGEHIAASYQQRLQLDHQASTRTAFEPLITHSSSEESIATFLHETLNRLIG